MSLSIQVVTNQPIHVDIIYLFYTYLCYHIGVYVSVFKEIFFLACFFHIALKRTASNRYHHAEADPGVIGHYSELPNPSLQPNYLKCEHLEIILSFINQLLNSLFDKVKNIYIPVSNQKQFQTLLFGLFPIDCYFV